MTVTYGRRARPARLLLGVIAVAATVLGGSASSADAVVPPAPPLSLEDRGWVWPVSGSHVHRPYEAPPHEYGPGHRGIDLRPVGSDLVRSPAAGVVAYAGAVAGRGIVTIDHGDGLVTTLEPVVAGLDEGAPVERGGPVGTMSVGGHADPGTVHFGVRMDGEYINPMLLLGGVPRAVLLPCC